MISIHAPAKGATTILRNSPDTDKNFNPRSREGSDFLNPVHASIHDDFNPRSREGSDQIPKLPERKMHISIHAPAKGATYI